MATRRVEGFTLIEMMVVVALVAIFVTAGLPAFLDLLDRRRITTATESLAGQVRQARAIARETSSIIGIVFTGSNDSWCIGLTDNSTLACDCESTDSTASNSCLVPVSAVEDVDTGILSRARELARADASLYPGVSLVSAPPSIGFEPLRGLRMGVSSANAVVLNSARGLETRIAVNEVGRINVCSPEGATRVIGIRPCL